MGTFIGGLNVTGDRSKMQNCKCIVGTPGRIVQLIQTKVLNVEHIRLFVLDEADKLLETSYLADINQINKSLKSRKQMIAASATIESRLQSILGSYMKNPTHVTPKREIPVLIGITQFAYEVETECNVVQEMLTKVTEMISIFTRVSFKQCLVFSNSQSRAESYFNLLEKKGWPVDIIIGAYDQVRRTETLRKLKEFKFRILVTTDLMARGIDSENIDLVINVDIPYSGPIYLHRIGRAGRYGSHGIAITFYKHGEDLMNFRKILGSIGGSKMSVLKFPMEKWPENWEIEQKNLEKCKESFGEIFGLTIDDDIEEDNLSSSDKNIDTVTENLMLLEITKVLVDKPDSRNQENLVNIFDDYKINSEISFTDEMNKDTTSEQISEIKIIPENITTNPITFESLNLFDDYKQNIHQETDDESITNPDDPKSEATKGLSIVSNCGSEHEDDPDEYDSRIPQISSSSISDNESSSGSSDDSAEDEESFEEVEDCDNYYRNVIHEYTSMQNIWYRQFLEQASAIQSYVNFCRVNYSHT